MRTPQKILSVFLLMASASCSTRQSPTTSTPTPGLDRLEHLVQCPPEPAEFTTLVPTPPPLAVGESWAQHLNLYVAAFFEQRHRAEQTAVWRVAHPGC
jgi:hypothetical protein